MKNIDLNLDFGEIENHDDYKNLWKNLPPVIVKMTEKNESCRHELGDSFIFDNPYTRPNNICQALLHVLDLYLWRSVLGFPSWNEVRIKKERYGK